MNERFKKFIVEKKYMIYMVLFLIIFHIICNLNIKTISFSSDEYIPLSIAAKLSGLDWMHSRNFNYYYGYITLLFFIPIFKIPLIYQNTFLLTQVLLGINSLFHIAATIVIYLSAELLFEKSTDKRLLAVVSLISTCSLQVFSISMGIQIESLFVLAYAICFYSIVRVAKDKANYCDMISFAFFSYIAIANNSRGYVLLISIFMCLAFVCIKEKNYWKYLLCFFVSAIVFLVVHKYMINPQYSKFFESNSYNTTAQPLADNLLLILKDPTYLKGFIKAGLGWMWSCNVSTLGLFFVAIFMILKEYTDFFKKKNIWELIVPSFILLNIIGISVLCITSCINGVVSALYGGWTERADLVFYVRYFVAILTVTTVYALYSIIEKNIFKKIGMKILYIAVTVLSSLAFIYFIGTPVWDMRYGVNNSVFVSLFLKGFDETYRYGYVDLTMLYYMVIFIVIIAVLTVLLFHKKKILLTVLLVISLLTCGIYTMDIAKNKSSYYENIFSDDIIAACEDNKTLDIYVSDFAPVLQYNVPEARIYYEFDNQDILIVKEDKTGLLDETNDEYEYFATYDSWTLLKKANTEIVQ